MATFDLNVLCDPLNDVGKNSKQCGVSFAKKALKLDSEGDAFQVVQAIEACPRLEYFDLEGNTLGPHAAKVIADVLKRKGAPLKRALWKDMFTSRSKEEIPKALESLGTALCSAGTQLVELDLSDNAFGPIGVQGLAAFLTSSTCYTLRELRLNNNGLGISGGCMLAKALLDCHNNSIKSGNAPLALRVFIAGRNRLENEGAKALASVFRQLKSLEEVSMPQNGIYHIGITALANSLSYNPGLRILDLNDNTVGPKGAKALARALPKLRNLEQLNLGDCLLKTKGCLILCAALELENSHPYLKKINLSYNEIYTGAAPYIVQVMADKKHLTDLHLECNSFGSRGREILKQLVQESNQAPALHLADDETGDEGEDEDEDEPEPDDVDESEDGNEAKYGIQMQDGEETFEDEEEDDEDDGDEDEDDENEYDDNDNDDDATDEDEDVDDEESDYEGIDSTVFEFLATQNPEKLPLLSKDVLRDFIKHAKEVARKSDSPAKVKFAEEFTRVTVMVSSFCGHSRYDIRSRAESLTDALYSRLCAFAAKKQESYFWSNALLVYCGLIKGEDKQTKLDWSLEGAFKALEKISQRDYFLPDLRDTLRFFLEKPPKVNRTKVADPFQQSKDSLQTVLASSKQHCKSTEYDWFTEHQR